MFERAKKVSHICRWNLIGLVWFRFDNFFFFEKTKPIGVLNYCTNRLGLVVSSTKVVFDLILRISKC